MEMGNDDGAVFCDACLDFRVGKRLESLLRVAKLVGGFA